MKRAVVIPEPALVDLAENGRKEYALRIVNDRPVLVVVCIGFTIAGLDHEQYELFEARMLRFAETLGKLDHPVIGLIFQRRKAQGKRHWAEFTCETPEAVLPLPQKQAA